MRYLIVKPSSIGDIVHCLPLARILKDHDPDAHISWIVNDNLAELLTLADDVDELLRFHRKEWGRLTGWGGLFRFLKQLNKREWDYVIDVQGLFRSGLFTWYAGNRKNTFGFADAREFAPKFYRHKTLVPNDIVHAVDKNLHLISDVLGEKKDYASPRFSIDADTASSVDSLMAEHGLASGRMIAVSPRSRWASKDWPPEFFSEVLDHAAEQDAQLQFWLLGLAADKDCGNEIARSCRKASVQNLMGETSLPQVVAMLMRSNALLTNDSGPMHIAAAVSTPTVSLFGPTRPEKTGPYGDIHTTFSAGVDCSPCFKRVCPLPEQICRAIDPQTVAQAVCTSCNLPQAT